MFLNWGGRESVPHLSLYNAFFFLRIFLMASIFFFPFIDCPPSNSSPTPLLVTLTNHCDRCRYSHHYYVVVVSLRLLKKRHTHTPYHILFVQSVQKKT